MPGQRMPDIKQPGVICHGSILKKPAAMHRGGLRYLPLSFTRELSGAIAPTIALILFRFIDSLI